MTSRSSGSASQRTPPAHSALPWPRRGLALLGLSLAWLAAQPTWAADTFRLASSMSSQRSGHTSTLLPNGKVLVAGGRSTSLPMPAAAELYDPATGTWSTTGSLATPRQDHTATLLSNGKVLITGGVGFGGLLASAELYDPAAGTWSAAGSIGTARIGHSATLLLNGKLLVAGGSNGAGIAYASVMLYDPATGTWSASASLATPRYSHTATLLPDGQVLIAGGLTTGDVLASAALYDPATGTWSPTGSMATLRSSHTATLLSTGQVLVAGGQGSGFPAGAELYDPISGTWSATGSLVTARAFHTATLLPNGKLLVAAGFDGGRLASAELYDPAAGTWSATGDLSTGTFGHAATLLPNGEVLVTGGFDGSYLSRAERYDSASGSWSATSSIATARYLHTATLLANGEVLAVGGSDGSNNIASAERYDPTTAIWSTAGSLATPRNSASASLLLDGKVLVVGGYHGGSLTSAELYDPVAGTWSTTGSLTGARYVHTATLLPSGKVLVAGGSDTIGNALATVELYDPATGTWSATGSLAAGRSHHTATLLPNGKVLVAGGAGNISLLASAELYDPGTGTWSATGALPEANQRHTATLLPNGKVLVAGGNNGSLLPYAALYNPATGTWSATGLPAAERYYNTATLLPNGKVLIAGGYDNTSTTVASAELYDPASGTWSTTASLASARRYHTATLLLNGSVLFAGGDGGVVLNSAELYDAGLGFAPTSQPVITTAMINGTSALVLTGTTFTGISSASGGNSGQDSASNYPLVQLRRLDNAQSTFLRPDPNVSMTATDYRSTSLTGLANGHYAVTVFTNGIPGTSIVLDFVLPTIQLAGNGLGIPNADSTPSPADGTDFGNVALLNTTRSRSFTVSNAGLGALSLNSITISGTAAADFAVTAQPASLLSPAGSTSFSITFDPHLPGLRTALVSISNNDTIANPYTFAVSGFGALAVKRPQTIAFTAPATVYLGQSPLALNALASSGLPVTLSIISGTATVAGSALTLTVPGTVQVRATQTGDGVYAAAPAVTRTLAVRTDPTVLTLIDLAQTYDGNPKPIRTLGGTAPVITYRIGAVTGPTVPTNAGRYPVTVADGPVTKTGTLVIAKAVLHVSPDDKRKFAGRANPALSAVISGYQGADTPAVVTTAPVLSTTAMLNSPRGSYPITARGGAALNYTFNYRQGTMVVESFAGGYEALLVDGSSQAVGKLNITPSGTTAFSGRLFVGTEATPMALAGTLATNPGTNRASASVINIAPGGTPYVTSFILPLSDAEPLTASVVRDHVPFGTASDGRKLSTATVLYAGDHTAVMEPATPAGINVPAGAGWATAKIDRNGVMILAGRLGDGTAFTTTVAPDTARNPGYRVFVQPYRAARQGAYLGGQFVLTEHPTLTNRRYLTAASLTWQKTGLPADISYRAGFGPVSTVLMMDPWLAPKTTAPAISLAQRLGLTGTNFNVTHSATGSASNGALPTRLNLSATNVVSVVLPPANLTRWKTLTFVPTTGTFTGSFVLTDGAQTRTASFSGVLRQPATAPDALIGDGHYLLPPLTGTERTTGEVMFTKP
jgi:WD40 repeat protein